MTTPDRPDELDTILRDAGRTWREHQPPPPAVDPGRFRTRRSRARWVPVLAAACVAAIVLAVAVIRLTDRSGSVGPVESPGDRPSYLVRNGDRVEVTGQVIAATGKPVIYCPPLASPGTTTDDQAPTCGDFAITLDGVDPARLAKRTTHSWGVDGYARIRGVWQDRTITVGEQTAPPADELTGPPDKDPVPCPPPAGGWPVPDSPRRTLPSTVAVQRYVAEHPDRFGASWVAFPQGMQRPAAAWTVPVVLVVTLLQGDAGQAQRDLQPLYDGTICVSPSEVTRSRLMAAAHAGEELFRDSRNAIWETTGVGPTDEETARDGLIEVHLLVVDDRLFAEYRRLGLDLFDLRPAVTRVS